MVEWLWKDPNILHVFKGIAQQCLGCQVDLERLLPDSNGAKTDEASKL